jgi:hypothetical protein
MTYPDSLAIAHGNVRKTFFNRRHKTPRQLRFTAKMALM